MCFVLLFVCDCVLIMMFCCFLGCGFVFCLKCLMCLCLVIWNGMLCWRWWVSMFGLCGLMVLYGLVGLVGLVRLVMMWCVVMFILGD